ncbi:hypothetical protein ABZS86_35235 [Streptomyces sp. NPDC005355]|uniref:hypothetical protein n=1 Tax=Streptomyces sp. NPDC005355 TaxID=3157038 RepID=UPI0033B3A1C1
MTPIRRSGVTVLVVSAVLALTSCGTSTEMNCSGSSQCAGDRNDHREGGAADDGQAPAEAATHAPQGDGSPKADESGFTTLYKDRNLKVGLAFPNNCYDTFVDFDKGRAWSADDRGDDEAEINLKSCYVEFGQYINARSAGFSDIQHPDARQCMEASQTGGLQTIEGWDAVYEQKPIKQGMTLCIETELGNIARAEVTEATWKLYDDGVHRPFYIFKTTAWKPEE